MRRLVIWPTLFVASLAVGCSTQEAEPAPSGAAGKADTTGSIAPIPGAPAASLLRDLAPVETRKKGHYRIVNDALRSPGAAQVLLERLRTGGERSHVRQAIADALPRSNGDWQAAAVELIASDRDPAVRAHLVANMRRASRANALEGLRLGLADGDAAVRAEAARTAGNHSAGAELADELVAALSDSDTEVRIAAAKTSGTHEIAAAADQLVNLTADDSAELRLAALRGLGRIDAARAAQVAASSSLDRDDDDRVRRVALRLSTSSN